MTCAVCGTSLPDDARFCPNCGAAVDTPVGTDERKMVTVLFADLVDSTRLGQRLDPERAREIMARFFDAAAAELHALRGRPEKFIGDAVMAVFGLPTVGEDDAIRAVRAGLAIQGRMRRLCESLGLTDPLEVRVGIESGEAATGLGPAGQLLVTGQVVNAAARLQEAAEPGEVLVGATTFALTETALSYGEPRNVPAKGFDTDLVAFPVEGLTARSTRRTIPFVGRASELTILRESQSRARSAGRPVFATIFGEQGVGKSRLVDELIAGLGGDVAVLMGRARPFADTTTFAPIAAMVGDLANVDRSEAPEKLRLHLHELVERTGVPEPDRTVDRLSLLFGVAERRDESAFVNDVGAGFAALVDALAGPASAVIVFEDAQSLKPPMLDLIERLGAAGRGGLSRIMVVTLARPDLLDRRPTWGSSSANSLTLRLDPLSHEESVDLVNQAGGGRVGEADAQEIARRAGGNPFFIVETTGMLLHEGGGPSRSRTNLPPTVQAVVSARLDALPPRLRELTRLASTFFVSFDLDELTVVDPRATREELDQLEDAEILVRDEGSRRHVERWRLRHSTLKEVAYASLPKRERVRLHLLIADKLRASDHASWAADHLELAAVASLDLDPRNRTVAERAAEALAAAGDRARRRMESRSALDYYERALATAGPEENWGVREARALAGSGEAHYWLGAYAHAIEVLDRAVALGTKTDDQFSLALALRFLGDIAINVDGDLDKAEDLLDRSLEAAERLGDPWAIARTLLFAGWVPWTRQRYTDADQIWRRALEIADPDDGWARVRALNSLSINRVEMGGAGPERRTAAEDALRLSDEAAALAEGIGDQFSIAITSVQRGRVLGDLGRLEDELLCLDDAIATFEELGARWELADAIGERGIARRELGRLDEAEKDLKRAIRISEEIGERQLASWTWRALARISERRGDMAKAEAQVRRSREAEEPYNRSREAEPSGPK
jgi:class 3 adenylate cyclase/tetratricopeptide (TPR) repeat protein